MNIFVVDKDPAVASTLLPDKLLVKMVLETAQLLSTAVNESSGTTHEDLYKSTHVNHPCSLWTRESSSNFLWLYMYGIGLGREYTKRYIKVHKSVRVIINSMKYFKELPIKHSTEFVQCMPDSFKDEDVVTAYRNYLKSKPYFNEGYKHSQKPEW